MPIKLQCPRCKRPLSVPARLRGTYSACPSCKGRLWIPDEETDAASPGKTPAAAMGATTSPPSDQPAPPPDASRSKPASPAPTKAPVATPAKPGKKVARFITSRPVESTLDIAEDGQLPELQLEEGEQPKGKKEADEESETNPAVIFGLFAVSVVASLAMLLIDTEAPGVSSSQEKAEARLILREQYFSDVIGPEPRETYQVYLRRAQRAHSRGDFQTEKRLYRDVLRLLRSERGPFEHITGSPERDRILKEQVTILLSGG